MSRLSKTVVLKYRDSSKKESDPQVAAPDDTAVAQAPAEPSPASSSSSSSALSGPVSSSKPLGALIDAAAVRTAIEQLYTFDLDEDEQWKAKADEVALALGALRNRWKELDATRKATAPKPTRGGMAPRGPGRRPGRKPKQRRD